MVHLIQRFRHFAVALVAGAIALSSAERAQAYDVDTHFYETYLMARYVGIGHDVALELATYAEWVDQNAMTSPLNPLLLTGERSRRLFHFPVPLFDRYSYGKTQNQHGVKINALDTAQENSPMSNELLWTGLKYGDLVMVGGGIHVLQDSFGHSNYAPATGHAEGGHGPDRSWQYYEKHRRMANTVIPVLTLIRKTLPESALDKNFREGGDGQAHYLLDGKTLAEKYDKNQEIQSLIKKNTLRDPRYTRYVLDFMIREAKKRNVFAEQYDSNRILNDKGLWSQEPTVDEIVIGLANRALRLPPAQRDQILNMKTVTETVMKDYYKTEASFDRMPESEKTGYINEFARRIFAHIVPKELGRDHSVMFEYDHGIRKAEILIRVSDRQEMIEKMFGQRVIFTKETTEKAAANVAKAVENGNAFKELGEIEEMEMRVSQFENLNVAKSEVGTPNAKARRMWRWKLFKYTYIDLAVGALGYVLKKTGLVNAKTRIGNTRFDPSKGAALYQRERAFELMMAFGIVKKLATDDDIKALRNEHDKDNKKLREIGMDVDSAVRRVAEELKGKTLGDLVESTIGDRGKARPLRQCRDLFSGI